MRLLASEPATQAAEVLDQILERHARNDARDGAYSDELKDLWHLLVKDDWHKIGVPEERGGGGLDLLDLTAISAVWGKHLLPLPFIPTLLLRRWGVEAATDAQLTFASGTPEAAVPYGTLPGVIVSEDLRCTGSAPNPGSPTRVTDWAPSLPLTWASHSTLGVSGEHIAEFLALACADLSGGAGVLVRKTLAYTKERQQFGRAISDFQAVQHKLADMLRDLETARSATCWAANETTEAVHAASVCWSSCQGIADAAVQLHGGFGFTWEAGLHFYVRHISSWGAVLRANGVATID